jgi:hypothetical protein
VFTVVGFTKACIFEFLISLTFICTGCNCEIGRAA